MPDPIDPMTQMDSDGTNKVYELPLLKPGDRIAVSFIAEHRRVGVVLEDGRIAFDHEEVRPQTEPPIRFDGPRSPFGSKPQWTIKEGDKLGLHDADDKMLDWVYVQDDGTVNLYNRDICEQIWCGRLSEILTIKAAIALAILDWIHGNLHVDAISTQEEIAHQIAEVVAKVLLKRYGVPSSE